MKRSKKILQKSKQITKVKLTGCIVKKIPITKNKFKGNFCQFTNIPYQQKNTETNFKNNTFEQTEGEMKR